jgi:hypothetical protein
MPDYNKGKIYKLTSPHTNDIYYGSTIQSLSKRKGNHKEKFLLWEKSNDKKLFCYSYKLFLLGKDDVIITLIENYPCNTKEELLSRERFFIENNVCVNKNIPLRTDKERYEINKKDILQKCKDYYIKNKDKVDNYKKEHYKENKEHFIDYKKKWYELNKERIKEKNKIKK